MQRTVVVGGSAWEWDGQSAQTITGIGSGPIVFDSTRGVILGHSSGVTWTYDGTATTTLATGGPDLTGTPALAYDAVRDRAVLFGTAPGFLVETWEWDGTSWMQIPSASGVTPPPRSDHGMAYHAQRGTVMLFGGQELLPFPPGSPVLSDLWEWDGTSWTELTTERSPPARARLALSYDTDRDRLLLIGGREFEALDTFGNLWELSPLTETGYACTGTVGAARLSSSSTHPSIGTTFSSEIHTIPNGAPTFGFLGLAPLTPVAPLDIIGMPHCQLGVDVLTTQALPTAGTSAAWDLPIPGDPTIVGTQFFMQALVGDPGANPFGATTTNVGVAAVQM